MGTNYYAYTKNKELAKKHFAKDKWSPEYTLVDEPDFGYEIHLGKRSGGWKPLFHAHENAYTCVSDMISFFNSYKSDFKFYNEYDEEMTFDDIKREFIDWGENQEPCYCRVVNKNGHKDLEEVPSGEPYDIAVPFSHIRYSEIMDPLYTSHFWEDKDGYDFTEGDFS